jgi:hypothetical protein
MRFHESTAGFLLIRHANPFAITAFGSDVEGQIDLAVAGISETRLDANDQHSQTVARLR